MQKKIKELSIEVNNTKREKLLDRGIIIINEGFDDVLYERVFFDLMKCIGNNNISNITIYINSNGGDVVALMPLVDLIDGTTKPIKTIITGKAYSAGCMLAICGHKGERYALKHSRLLIHEVASDGGYNKNSQIQENAKETYRINKMLINILKERTKMADKDIDKYMNSNKDIFITSQQALKLGVIDKII